MDVEARIEASFRKLLESKPYKSMSVKEICEDAGVARKTFYTHFQDKESIIDHIFRRDVTEPQYELHKMMPQDYSRENPALFNQRLYDCIFADRDFYYRLIGPLRGVDDTFLRVATWAIYDLNIKILQESPRFDDEWKVDYAAYFFGSSQAMFMQKWVSDGMKIGTDELADLYTRLAIPFWLDQ